MEFEASLTKENDPLAAPVDVGANWICTVTPCPAAIDPDGLLPTTENPVPEIVACEILTASVPVFVKLRFCVEVLPTTTLPKARLAELGAIVPVFTPPPPPWSILLV